MQEIGIKAKQASKLLAKATTIQKNNALKAISDALIAHEQEIIAENAKDVIMARINGMKDSLIDRLALNHDRILAMANSLLDIAKLDDPVREVLSMTKRPNGLLIGKKKSSYGCYWYHF